MSDRSHVMEAYLKSVFARIAALFMLFAGVLALASPASARTNVVPSLAFETLSPSAGSTVRVAIVFDAKPGWHTYWTNPGDAGAPPRVKWESEDGALFSRATHPAPKVLNVQGIASYVHEGQHALLLEMRVPQGLSQGAPFPVTARLDWLACSDSQCVPESATLQSMLVIGSGETDFPGLSKIRQAEARIPGAMSGVSYTREGSDWVFSIPGARAGATVLPSSTGWFDPGAAQSSKIADGKTLVRVRALSQSAPRSEFSGLVTSSAGSWAIASAVYIAPPKPVEVGVQKQELAGVPNPDEGNVKDSEPVQVEEERLVSDGSDAAAEQVSSDDRVLVTTIAATGQEGEWLQTAMLALLGAIAGGLILNLMPCVFPILSLKALSLAKAGSDAGAAKSEGLGYAAGAIATTTLFGAIIVSLKAAGVASGWSFQLQSPLVVFALLSVVLLVALNLVGAFEMRLPFAFSGSSQKGWKGSFATGSLAAFVATPCSGPFMAGALGAVLVLPTAAGLAVFAGLGLGMALPFLAIAFVPALRNMLPRPGAWMVKLKKWLSVPMFLTAAWLAWVLSNQTNESGLIIVLIATVICVIGFVWMGRNQFAGRRTLPALATACVAILAVPAIGLPAPSTANAASNEDGPIRSFSEERLNALRADGVPVFVDFTADWCLTCKVNEKAAINREETRKAFEDAGVVTLVGDWTNGDPEITRFLEKHGRNSIPFYLFYGSEGEGEVLPQVLTVEILASKARSSAE